MTILIEMLAAHVPVSQAADPSTLYAASAAAAGALVAIIGGFLISRVVGLLAQKEALQMRRRELAQRVELAADALAAIHGERLAVSVGWFDDKHLRTIVAKRGLVDIEALTNDSDFRGTTREEMREAASRRAAQVQAAFARIEAVAPSGDVSDLSKLDITIPASEREVWQAVADAITRRRRPPATPSWLPGAGLIARPETLSDLQYRRQDQRIRDERQAGAEVTALEAANKLVDEELARLAAGLPKLLTSIGILAYFAFGKPYSPVTRSRTAPWRDGEFGGSSSRACAYSSASSSRRPGRFDRASAGNDGRRSRILAGDGTAKAAGTPGTSLS